MDAFDQFISDIRATKKLEKFEGGIPAERDKANAIVDAFNAWKDAADRAVANKAAGGDETFEGYVVDGGASVLYELFGAPVA